MKNPKFLHISASSFLPNLIGGLLLYPAVVMGANSETPCQSNSDCIGSNCMVSSVTPEIDENCPDGYYKAYWYDNIAVYQCRMASNIKCKNGAYTTKISQVPIGSNCTVEVQICDPCYACQKQKDWQDLGNGYMRRAKSCSNNRYMPALCIEEYTYQCAAGYYGNPTSATSGCTKCPSSATGVAGLSPAGATSESQCYINAEEKICDDSGCFKCSANYEYVK